MRNPARLINLSIGLVLLLACVILFLSAKRAHPHSAPSGWAYDPTCCSGYDCAPAPVGSVTATPEGWRVQIEPGDHPMVRILPLDEVVPYSDPRILPSGDSLFHACVSGARGAILCLYVPEGQYGS
jgi:hypothetical protein